MKHIFIASVIIAVGFVSCAATPDEQQFVPDVWPWEEPFECSFECPEDAPPKVPKPDKPKPVTPTTVPDVTLAEISPWKSCLYPDLVEPPLPHVDLELC